MREYLLIPCILVSLICLSFKGHGQSSCALTLRTARTTYDQGRLQDLPALLDNCLKDGFTKQEKVEAYKLLVLSYIYLEEPSRANAAMLELLRTDPYFELNESADAAEFISLYKTFRTWPIYRLGAKLGVNATSPSIVSSADALTGAAVSYSPSINFQSGIVFEIPVSPRLTLNPELYFQVRSFNYKSSLDLTGALDNSSRGKETHNLLSLPVSLQFEISESKLHPYVSAGVSVDYLFNARITMNRHRVNAPSVQERTFDVTSSRNKINFNAVASVGTKLKLGSGFVVGELRVVYGLRKINEPGSAYTIDDYLLFDNAYADNLMKLNSLTICVGYIYNVFNPTKLKIRK